MITHDLGVVAEMANNVLVMYAGRPVEYGTVDQVFYRPLHPYTWGLLDSLPRHDVDEKGRLCPIKGQPPSLINLPSGCSFSPRCSFATDECRCTPQPLTEIEPGHLSACQYSGDKEFLAQSAYCPVEVR